MENVNGKHKASPKRAERLIMRDIHPYYVSKAEDVLRKLRFDKDADPMPLAVWAQNAPRKEFVFVTSDGRIVGRGRFHRTPAGTVGYADDETTDRYQLFGNELGLAAAQIARQLGRPVIEVRTWMFAGSSTHRANRDNFSATGMEV